MQGDELYQNYVSEYRRADDARRAEENAWEEVERLKAKLAQPCGSCHPCENWRDETWRRAGRKPPHVHEWDEARATLKRVAAYAEHCSGSANSAYAKAGRELLAILLDDGEVSDGEPDDYATRHNMSASQDEMQAALDNYLRRD